MRLARHPVGATLGSRRQLHGDIARLTRPAHLALIEIAGLPAIVQRFGEEAAEQARAFVFSRLLRRLRCALYRVSEDRVAGLYCDIPVADIETELAATAALVASYPFRVRAVDRRPIRHAGRVCELRGGPFTGPEVTLALAVTTIPVSPGDSPAATLIHAQRKLSLTADAGSEAGEQG